MSQTAESGPLSTIERRAFLRRAGLGAAAAGAVWAAPAITGFDAAFAGASCALQETINWNDYTTGSAFPGKSFPPVGGYPALTVGLTNATVGTPAPSPSNQTVSSGTLGGQTANWWGLFMTCDATGEGYDATFTFTAPVYNLRFTLFDIDRYNNPNNATGFQDVVWLTGAAFTATKPGMTVVGGDGTVAIPWVGTTPFEVPVDSVNGNVAVTMPAVASSFTLSYRSGNQLNNNQRIGIGNLVFCR